MIVQDQGPGIEANDQEKLFKPFKTLENSSKINPNGVGIGLFVSKLLCERSGGDICCFSDGQGCGTTFEFRIYLKSRRARRNNVGSHYLFSNQRKMLLVGESNSSDDHISFDDSRNHLMEVPAF